MELLLETVALYSLKLAYETEGHSPIPVSYTHLTLPTSDLV